MTLNLLRLGESRRISKQSSERVLVAIHRRQNVNGTPSRSVSPDFQMSNNAWASNGRDRQQPYSPSEGPPTSLFNSQEVRDCLKIGIFGDSTSHGQALTCTSNQKSYPRRSQSSKMPAWRREQFEIWGSLGLQSHVHRHSKFTILGANNV